MTRIEDFFFKTYVQFRSAINQWPVPQFKLNMDTHTYVMQSNKPKKERKNKKEERRKRKKKKDRRRRRREEEEER